MRKRFLLSPALFLALGSGVEAQGGLIGSGFLFSDGRPCCILGHAAASDGLAGQAAENAVYCPETDPVPTPMLTALREAGITWGVNDTALRANKYRRVTFEQWCDLVGVGIDGIDNVEEATNA